MDLNINISKTKILIFNKTGRVIKDVCFYIDNIKLENVDQYPYLGIKLKPSGSMNCAADELSIKAGKAWFSISNILYKNKRMDIFRALNLFHCLISPVALHASEFWLPYILPKKCFKGESSLFDFWQNFKCEVINQRCCRMLLSVDKKTTR